LAYNLADKLRGAPETWQGVTAMGRVASALLRVTVGGALYVGPRLFYDVEIHGLEHDTGAPRTYLAISHKRDLDAMAPIPPLLAHRGWRAFTSDVHFAMRSDAFEPGFLARMALRPRWLSFLLRPLSVGTPVRDLGIHPLTDLHRRPAEVWIRELLGAEGDTRAGDVLAPRFARELAAATHQRPEQIEDQPLSRLLAWRYHRPLQTYWGPDFFVGRARRRAERRVLARVKGELADLGQWLWSGGSLVGSPEGGLSPDGKLASITSGLHRLLSAGPPDTRIVPIFEIYDFMTTGRPRILVDLAPAIEHVPTLPPRQLDAWLRQAWLETARFTCTQLASGFLVEAARTGLPSFALDDVALHVEYEAAALAEAGRHVDHRLLRPGGARRLAARYLAYARRRGLVRRAKQRLWSPVPVNTTVTVRLGEVGYIGQPLAYAWNELQEMLSVDAPADTGVITEARASE
jgi:hypothetical protein